MRRLIHLVIPCLLLSGCFGPGEGVEVPVNEIYFPVGMAVDKDAEHLFVVSSDFDLQYNGGSIQSFDLEDLYAELPVRCTEDADCNDGQLCQQGMCAAQGKSPCPSGDREDASRLLYPGRCNPIEIPTFDRVKIGAFATDAIIRERPDSAPKDPDAPERLFVPVRGDSTLHWLDVKNGKLECGQAGSSDGSCDDQHRAGDDPTKNSRGLELNVEPFAIDADAGGNTIVVTNQTTGTASLFLNESWDSKGPQLSFELSGNGIPRLAVGIASLPQPLAPGEVANPYSTYMMTFRNAAQVRLIRFAPDDLSPVNSPRPYLVDGYGVGIEANSVGTDSRGIALDAAARKKAKDACAAGDTTCADAAALVPIDVYVANRAPSSLLIGRTRPPQEYPYFYQSVALTTGPSRVVVGHVTTPEGEDETRVFVACFDSRRIFVYDPQRARIETEILTGRGPHAMTVDTQRQLLYVGHFTDSYVGVYSLDLAHPATYGTMLGTLGTPKSPRASK
ncbi:MAG TPA: hypothetical protein VHP33_20915 [Polyangiaceae bacterium]|nr:hypothetical protein [Polyangiaceae bacterium]